jgi:hypothetical protein
VAESSELIVVEGGLIESSTYPRRCWHCSNGRTWLRQRRKLEEDN